jgi:hypothetical protein
MTWRLVMQTPPVATALAAAITGKAAMERLTCATSGNEELRGNADAAAADPFPGEEYLVLGSSIGWMVLFAAITYGVRSRYVISDARLLDEDARGFPHEALRRCSMGPPPVERVQREASHAVLVVGTASCAGPRPSARRARCRRGIRLLGAGGGMR